MEQKKTAVDYTEEERNEILERTSAKYKSMVESGEFKDLLVKFGQNGNFSINNVLFMLAQNPDMTIAKNMSEWLDAGRHIREGAKSLEIMAPTKTAYQTEAKDRDGKPKTDKDGNPVILTKERVDGFHPVYVFDIADTDGEEYKPYVIGAKVSDEEKKMVLDGVHGALQAKYYHFKFTDAGEFAKDETYKIDKSKKTVRIRKGMNNTATVLTAIEAASKAICDTYKGANFEGLTGENTGVLESKSRNCILASHFGLDPQGIEFGEMREMSAEDTEAFRNNLSLVCAGTKLVMDKVSRSFYKARQAQADSAPTESVEIPDRDPFRPDRAKQSAMEVA